MRGFTYLEDQSWLERNVTRRGASSELPISLSQARRVTEWLKTNWGDKIETSTAGSNFPPHIVCAIACQETAYFWVGRIDKMPAAAVLGRCVLDASGEMASDPRSAFPRNTDVFRAKYGDEFTDMLITEANTTRSMRNLGPKQWVYKGYGIFQYDLQYVGDDEDFFREKGWYDIDQCIQRVMKELNGKWKATGDLWRSVKAYNGSGSRAEQYMKNVRQFADVTEEIWDKTPGPAPKPEQPATPEAAKPGEPATPPGDKPSPDAAVV